MAVEGSLSVVVSALLLALPQVLLAAEGLVELVLTDDGVLKKTDSYFYKLREVAIGDVLDAHTITLKRHRFPYNQLITHPSFERMSGLLTVNISFGYDTKSRIHLA